MKWYDKILWYLHVGGKLSQAFEGEDIFLWRYFKDRNIRDGFYIDVGAYHPRHYSNTWILRKRLNFKGINIEPSTKGYHQLLIHRRNDINLNCLCGVGDGVSSYSYNKKEPALSKIGSGEPKHMLTLSTICRLYKVTKIDLLSIDIEGWELEVLRWHDWNIKPRIIIVEVNCQPIESYLHKHGYKLIGKTTRNEIY